MQREALLVGGLWVACIGAVEVVSPAQLSDAASLALAFSGLFAALAYSRVVIELMRLGRLAGWAAGLFWVGAIVVAGSAPPDLRNVYLAVGVVVVTPLIERGRRNARAAVVRELSAVGSAGRVRALRNPAKRHVS